MLIRLNKFLAEAGYCSRRKADEHISSGDVKVNDNVVKELGLKVDPTKDKVEFKNETVSNKSALVYYALYKPKGIISTASDDQGRQMVTDLVPRLPRVYPVGRLDEDSEGLIILTNDGDLTQKLTHPSFEHAKEYEVITRKPKQEIVPAEIEQRFKRGMEIDGKLMKADSIKVQPLNTKYLTLDITLHSGLNRQIRRMCAQMNLEVIKLTRIRIVNLSLSDLQLSPGQFKNITMDQII